MKKILIFIIGIYIVLPGFTYAQTQTPSNSTIPSSKTLDEIKDKIASRVAELNLVEKKGVIGVVNSATDTQIILNTLSDKKRIIEVDEFTDFSSKDNNTFGISDIEEGSIISALGLYNKESERLLARFINEISIPIFIHGVITKTNEDDFTVTISTVEGKDYIVDIERISKTFAFNNGELDTWGFSKINTLENALVIGFVSNSEDENRITASKMIVFPDSPANPKVKIDIKPSSPTPTDTT